jgi:uncharacterized protein DUF6766
MRKFVRENSLGLAAFLLFAVSLAGQIATGFSVANDDREEHGEPPIALSSYVVSGHFIEAVFENWESEFLQMAAFVVLTVWLRQKGSPESKPLEEQQPQDKEPRRRRRGAPWPVGRGGLVLKLYENSLGLALIGLFFFSFALHAVGGAAEYNEEQQSHGSKEQVTAISYVSKSRFWFESFQNWQSEFMSVGALVVLSIFLRQKGSPESKPVDHPHAQTGSE